MNREQIIEKVKSGMPERRWLHTEGVMSSAILLAKRYGEDPIQAELAAILHDVTKYWPIKEMEKLIRDKDLPLDLLLYDASLWHAPVGAWVAEHEYGITDTMVLDAIRYHTSGRRGMTALDKIVCLADYIEPGRNYPGVENIRELSMVSLNRALIAGFDSTITFLIEKGKPIYPLTIESRNALLEEE